MSDSSSIICFVAFNYKFLSSIICVVYLVISTIYLFKFTLTINHEYPQYLRKSIKDGAKASIGLLISSAMALFGIVLSSPFLMMPLMLMHIIIFALIKFLFYDLLMYATHGPNPSMILAISLCISFVAITIFLLWLIYCAFIQISMTVWPDSPISCRISRRDSSTSTTTTTERNGDLATRRDGNPVS